MRNISLTPDKELNIFGIWNAFLHRPMQEVQTLENGPVFGPPCSSETKAFNMMTKHISLFISRFSREMFRDVRYNEKDSDTLDKRNVPVVTVCQVTSLNFHWSSKAAHLL